MNFPWRSVFITAKSTKNKIILTFFFTSELITHNILGVSISNITFTMHVFSDYRKWEITHNGIALDWSQSFKPVPNGSHREPCSSWNYLVQHKHKKLKNFNNAPA